jgi:hypothetical protein
VTAEDDIAQIFVCDVTAVDTYAHMYRETYWVTTAFMSRPLGRGFRGLCWVNT